MVFTANHADIVFASVRDDSPNRSGRPTSHGRETETTLSVIRFNSRASEDVVARGEDASVKEGEEWHRRSKSMDVTIEMKRISRTNARPVD